MSDNLQLGPGPLSVLSHKALATGKYVHSAAFSPDDKFVVVQFQGRSEKADEKQLVWIWDLQKGKVISQIPGCSRSVFDFAFTKDGSTLICVGESAKKHMGGEISFWKVGDWTRKKIIVGEELWTIRSVAVDSQSGQLVTSDGTTGASKKLYHWDQKGKLLRNFGTPQTDARSIIWAPDGKAIAIGDTRECTVSLWSSSSGRKLWSQRAHSGGGYDVGVKFAPDGKLLATYGDKNIALWSAAKGERQAVLKGHNSRVSCVAFSPDGKFLYSSSLSQFCVWDSTSGKLLANQNLPRVSLDIFAVSSDGKTLTAVHRFNQESSVLQFALSDPTAPMPQAAKSLAKKPAATLSSREQELRAAVLADPENDAPRLKYADWLDSEKDPRGKFIRLQFQYEQLAKLPKPTESQKKKRIELYAAANEILTKHFDQWLAPLASLQLRPSQVEFRRGFLHRLELHDVDITNNSLKLLASVPELEVLDLEGSGVTDAGMKHLLAVTNLSELWLGETAVTTKALKTLVDCERLVRVYNPDWGQKRNEALETWKEVRNKRFLELPKPHQRTEALRVLEYLVNPVPPLNDKSNPSISWSQSWATDGDLVYLQGLPEVEELDFFECSAVTSAGLVHLQHLKKLRVLRLSESGVKDLTPLKHVRSLEELDLSSLESLDPASFRHLTELPRLHKLTIRYCELDDQVLPHIAKCMQLREFYATSNDFRREALGPVVKLKHLKAIEIDYWDDMQGLFPPHLDPKKQKKKK